MAARSDNAHPFNGVPTLLIVDDHAAVLAGARGAPVTVARRWSPPTPQSRAVTVHDTRSRAGAGKRAVPTDWWLARIQTTRRRLSPHLTGRWVVAADADTMIDYQHRSTTR